MDYFTFEKLAKEYNVIPVTQTLLADTLTPVSAYLRIRKNSPASFLLESVEGGEKIARYSFLGRNPVFSLRTQNLQTEILKDGNIETIKENFFNYLVNIISEFKHPQSSELHVKLPRFTGGMVGYIGYDMVREIEAIPSANINDNNVDDALLGFFPTVLAFDHLKHQIIIIANVIIDKEKNLLNQYQKALEEINQFKKDLADPSMEYEIFHADELKIKLSTTKENFVTSVLKAKDYIKAGDAFQIVLSQRFSLAFEGDLFNVYRAIRLVNPSPYLYFLDYGDSKVIGSSPELLVRKEDKRAEIYPIAGTRPRGKSEEEDKQLEIELINDEKEKAEHVMLVDLARNDLGRVCKIGSVKVDEMMTIVRYSHVMHIASRVSGELADGKNAVDVFKAAFPAGTVSGAPKVRAMEIIDELETSRRGIYAGGVGYFDFSGNMDTCIAIRTIYAKNGTLYFQSGAGIVADSIPEKEYEETINKSRAMVEAIKIASGGFQ